MNENARALLSTVINGNFEVNGNNLYSGYLFNAYGILAVDLNYGNNRAVYEKGLLLRDKINSEVNSIYTELNI